MNIFTLISRIGLIRLLVPACAFTLILFVFCLTYFHMNLFLVASLSVASLSALLAFIVFAYSTKKVHQIWAIFNIIIVFWGLSSFLAGISSVSYRALIFWRLSLIVCTFISVVFYHVIIEFCQIKRSQMLTFAYIQAILFVPTILFSNFFISSTFLTFDSIYYYKATLLFALWSLLWFVIVGAAFYELFKFIIRSHGIQKTQALYMFWGMLLGHTGGASTILPAYNVHVYPVWHFSICIYAVLMTYAMFRYQLMDIRIAFTRLGIFAIVYSLVLGIPFGLVFWQEKWLKSVAGENWFWIPMVAVAILATIGPSVYFYIQKKAEDRLLQEQRRYQATLRQASAGMGKIKDLKKLLNMIVYVLTHAIQMEHALVYIHDEVQMKYVLGASKRKSGHIQFLANISEDTRLVKYFLENKNPVILEELKQKAIDLNDDQLIQIEQIISSLNGELLVPIFIDQSLTAFIVMGKKQSSKSYTEDDLSVFGILANQTALAIENARFYEQMKLTHEQLYQAEKMATIGTMADGLSHQINNRFHALGFIAGDALDTINMNRGELLADKMKEVLAELEHSFLRVQENVVQGGEIVQGLLKYSRKGVAGFTPIDVDAVLKAALEMVQFKIKTNELKIVREYDLATIPKVKGNFTQLQEVFFNLIDNGYDAMMQRKDEVKDSSYQPTLIVRVTQEENFAEIIFEDNGMGVKEEDMRKLFTPFFTTKLSSKKGTGLGLYVIKKIVEDNHGGKVEMVSKYMKGTQMKLRLPVAIA